MPSDRCLSVCSVGVLWPNGWMDEDETWHADSPRPWPHCVRWEPSSPSTKGAQPPIFQPISAVAKWLDGSRCHLVGARPQSKQHCVRWGPSSPPPKRGQNLPNFWPYLTDFGTNQKLICNFLLVINTNLPPILHRFRDIAFDRSKIAIFGYPSCV